MRWEVVSGIMPTLILIGVLTLTLPVHLVHANYTGKVAIDVTRLGSYKPTFWSATSALEAQGYTVDVWWDGEITASRLADCCTLIICCPQSPYTQSEVTAILNFVSSGHGLLFLGEYGKGGWSLWSNGYYPAGADPILGPLGISINNDLLIDPTNNQEHDFWLIIHSFPIKHPATDGISIYAPIATATLVVKAPGITIATGDDDTYAVDPEGADPRSDSPSALTVGTSGCYEPVLAASTYGMGRAVVAGDHNWITDGWSYYENIQLLVRVVNWLSPHYEAALVSVVSSSTEAYVGQVVNIAVVVRNAGNVPETLVVICKYELEGAENTIGIQAVTELAPNVSASLTFSWKTADITLHTIKAEILPLEGEADTTDNTLTSPVKVKVKMIGDVNGDNKVDISDIAQAALAFGSHPTNQRWNPQADLNQDGRVDIIDIAFIAKNFGKTYP